MEKLFNTFPRNLRSDTCAETEHVSRVGRFRTFAEEWSVAETADWLIAKFIMDSGPLFNYELWTIESAVIEIYGISPAK